MKTIVLLIGVAFVADSAFAGPFIETFGSGNGGFDTYRVTSSGSFTGISPSTWSATGGNPTGHISGALSTDVNSKLYAFEPGSAAPWGDMTGLYLTTDFRLEGSGVTSTPALTRFYVGTGNSFYITNDATSWDPNADTSWATHNVALQSSNFIAWPLAPPTLSFNQVIASPGYIGVLLAETSITSGSNIGVVGSGTILLDNFGTAAIPEPSSLALGMLAVIAGFVVGYRKRSRPRGRGNENMQ